MIDLEQFIASGLGQLIILASAVAFAGLIFMAVLAGIIDLFSEQD